MATFLVRTMLNGEHEVEANSSAEAANLAPLARWGNDQVISVSLISIAPSGCMNHFPNSETGICENCGTFDGNI